MSDAPTTDGTTKTKRPRSTAYPNHDLETAINFTKQMREKLGSGPYSRELAAQALGHPNVNGTSGAKIAACVHFGLLTRDGNTYSQSELSNMIFSPQDDDERNTGIKNAMLTPTLYSKLVSEYEGKGLPTMLDNILVRTYRLTQKVASQASADFKKSAEYSGVLVNGVINSLKDISTQATSDLEDNNDDFEQEIAKKQVFNAPASYLTVIIPGTDVRVVFPPEYAYDLSIGAFGEAIKSLGKAVNDNTSVVTNVEPNSDTDK